MDSQLSSDFASKDDLSVSSDLLNEAFIESSDEESYKQCKSFSTETCSTPQLCSNVSKCTGHYINRRKSTSDVNQKCKLQKQMKIMSDQKEVFEKISPRKCSFPLHFEIRPRSKIPLRENKIVKKYRDNATEFSPLEDISNKKLQPSNKRMFTITSRLGEIRIPKVSKGSSCAISDFNKNDTKSDVSGIVKNGETKSTKLSDCTKQGQSIYLNENLPILNRETNSKLPLLRSKETNLIEFQSPNSVNCKEKNKTRFGFEHPTPTSTCAIKRRSFQNENRLRKDRRIAEEKSRKSTIMLRESTENVNLKQGIEFSEKAIQNKLVLSEFQNTPILHVNEIPVKKLNDILSASQKEKISALVKEPGILEVTDLTLYTSTVHFTRTFEDAFTSPKS